MSKILGLFGRTLLASVICICLFMVSGKIFNFLPAIMFFPVLIFYYQQVVLWYFVIASEDIFSSVLGIMLSLLFIGLYIINISMAETIFVKGAGIFGIIIGVAQTIKSIGVRYQGGFYNA